VSFANGAKAALALALALASGACTVESFFGVAGTAARGIVSAGARTPAPGGTMAVSPCSAFVESFCAPAESTRVESALTAEPALVVITFAPVAAAVPTTNVTMNARTGFFIR